MDRAFTRLIYNYRMKLIRGLPFILTLFLFTCQPDTSLTVTIIDYDKTLTLETKERVPSAILSQAGLTLNADDHILVNGLLITADQPTSNSPVTLQIRRAVSITISSPRGEQTIRTSALTVGEALQEAGVQLSADDKADPGFNSPIPNSPFIIHYSPSSRLTVTADGETLQIRSSARTVGEALAEAGFPLLGSDYSLPAEDEELPLDGQLKVVRVNESLLLTQRPIPFGSELVASADVPLDQTQILQPGETGLSVERIRVRYEDGREISRATESKTVVRPPRTRVLGYGTKIDIKTAVVDGVTIEYWRAVEMYATAYSPCRSGGDRCYPGTSSGKKLAKGSVALRYNWYLAMGGQPLYIPGYGFATVDDVCGGCVGRPWIDLGYSDDDYQQWSSWVTVYFLTPVPATVIYVLE